MYNCSILSSLLSLFIISILIIFSQSIITSSSFTLAQTVVYPDRLNITYDFVTIPSEQSSLSSAPITNPTIFSAIIDSSRPELVVDGSSMPSVSTYLSFNLTFDTSSSSSSSSTSSPNKRTFKIRNAKFLKGLFLQLWVSRQDGSASSTTNNNNIMEIIIENTTISCSSTSLTTPITRPCSTWYQRNPLLILKENLRVSKEISTALRIEIGNVSSSSSSFSEENNNLFNISIDKSDLSITHFFAENTSRGDTTPFLLTTATRAKLIDIDPRTQEGIFDPTGPSLKFTPTSLFMRNSKIHAFVSGKDGSVLTQEKGENYKPYYHSAGLAIGEGNFDYYTTSPTNVYNNDDERTTMKMRRIDIRDCNFNVRNDLSNALAISLSHIELMKSSSSSLSGIFIENSQIYTLADRFVDFHAWSIGVQLTRVSGGDDYFLTSGNKIQIGQFEPIPQPGVIPTPSSSSNFFILRNCNMTQLKSMNKLTPKKITNSAELSRILGVSLQRVGNFSDVIVDGVTYFGQCALCSAHFFFVVVIENVRRRVWLNNAELLFDVRKGFQVAPIVYWWLTNVNAAMVTNIHRFEAPVHSSLEWKDDDYSLMFVLFFHNDIATNVGSFYIGGGGTSSSSQDDGGNAEVFKPLTVNIKRWCVLSWISVTSLNNVGSFVVEGISGKLTSQVVTAAVVFHANLSTNVSRISIKNVSAVFSPDFDQGTQAAAFLQANMTMRAQLFEVINCSLTMIEQTMRLPNRNSVFFVSVGATGLPFELKMVRIVNCKFVSGGLPLVAGAMMFGIDGEVLTKQSYYLSDPSQNNNFPTPNNNGTTFEIYSSSFELSGASCCLLWAAATLRSVPTWGYDALTPGPPIPGQPFGWLNTVDFKNVDATVNPTLTGNHINLHSSGISNLILENNRFQGRHGANPTPVIGTTLTSYPGSVGFVNITSSPNCNKFLKSSSGQQLENLMLVDVEEALEVGTPGITLEQEIIAKGCGGGGKDHQRTITPTSNMKQSQTSSLQQRKSASKLSSSKTPSSSKPLPPLDLSGAPSSATTIEGFSSSSSLLLAAGPSIALDAARSVSILAMAARCRSYADQVNANQGISRDEHRNIFVDNYLLQEISWPNNLFQICMGEERGKCIRGAVLSAFVGVVVMILLILCYGQFQYRRELPNMTPNQRKEMSFFRFCKAPVLLGNFFVWLFPTWFVFSTVLVAVPGVPASDKIFFGACSFIIFLVLVGMLFKIVYTRVDANPVVWIRQDSIKMFNEDLLDGGFLSKSKKQQEKSRKEKKLDEEDQEWLKQQEQQQQQQQDIKQNNTKKKEASSSRILKRSTLSSVAISNDNEDSQEYDFFDLEEEMKKHKNKTLRKCFRFIETNLLKSSVGAFFCFGSRVWTEPNRWKDCQPVAGGGSGSVLWNCGTFVNKQIGPFVEEKELVDKEYGQHHHHQLHRRSTTRTARRQSILSSSTGDKADPLLTSPMLSSSSSSSHASPSNSNSKRRRRQSHQVNSSQHQHQHHEQHEQEQEMTAVKTSQKTQLTSLGAVAIKKIFTSTFRLRCCPFYAFISFTWCFTNVLAEAIAIINPNLCDATLTVAAIINIIAFLIDCYLRPFSANFRNVTTCTSSVFVAIGSSIFAFYRSTTTNAEEDVLYTIATVCLIIGLVVGLIASLTNGFFKLLFLITGGQVILRRDVVEKMDQLMEANIRKARERKNKTKGASLVGGVNLGALVGSMEQL